jgi:hypothetical protein
MLAPSFIGVAQGGDGEVFTSVSKVELNAVSLASTAPLLIG